MSLLVTGSIGLDTVETPHGRVENVLGGTAVYFSLCASHFVPVRLVGVVGEDFPVVHRDLLMSRPIDLAGLEQRQGSHTFRWAGKYEGAMNEAETIGVHLNVLAERGPRVPAAFRNSDTVFLANTHPRLQLELLDQLESPKLTLCDTMNLWIETERDSLLEVMSRVTGVIVNDGEARLLTQKVNMVAAAEEMLGFGPQFIIIKKGEHGALLMSREGPTVIPAFPTKNVKDPTGAGDSFAGGFLGYLCAAGRHGNHVLRQAIVRGTICSSYTIEDFSVGRLKTLTRREIDERAKRFSEMLRID